MRAEQGRVQVLTAAGALKVRAVREGVVVDVEISPSAAFDLAHELAEASGHVIAASAPPWRERARGWTWPEPKRKRRSPRRAAAA